MKNFKVKSILSSLTAILMMAVFMISCEQELDPVADTLAENTESSSMEFMLPYGYNEQLSQAEVDAYMASLEQTDLDKLVKSQEILYYFVSLNKENTLRDNSNYGDIFDEKTLETYLSSEEVQGFQNFDVNTIELRGCSAWQNTNEYQYYYFRVAGILICNYQVKQTRTGCPWWRSEARWKTLWRC